MIDAAKERWSSGDAYEAWVGRWSRRVGRTFVDWLDVPPGRTWARLGAGADGSIALTARAWAVQGTVPAGPGPVPPARRTP